MNPLQLLGRRFFLKAFSISNPTEAKVETTQQIIYIWLCDVRKLNIVPVEIDAGIG